jgi:hypothetical protein
MGNGDDSALPDQRPKLQRRVIAAAESQLAKQKYVAPIDVITALGWLSQSHIDFWRSGRPPYLDGIAVDEDRVAESLHYLARWAQEQGLQRSEVPYVAATRDRRPLRFTISGEPTLELVFRTHQVAAGLSEKKREQIEARQSKAPDLAVIRPTKAWDCGSCGRHYEAEHFLLMEDDAPLCMDCADFGHLVFLPAGNATLSRRAKAESTLAVLVTEFNRRRKHYQRIGILIEQEALERAEEKNLADDDIRALRRVRDTERRAAGDIEFQAAMAEEIRNAFPGCPAERALEIATHAAQRGNGRVGRSAAGRALDAKAVRAAVVASVRHLDTPYDTLLMSGVAREDARARIRATIDQVLDGWETPVA